jgi:hypothetical protein
MNESSRREGSRGSTRVLSDSGLHKQVADFAAQRLAISEVQRAIASLPDDLQPILQSILDNAVSLCRAQEWGASSVWPRKQAFVSLHLI